MTGIKNHVIFIVVIFLFSVFLITMINNTVIAGASDSTYTGVFHLGDSVSCMVSAGGICNPTLSKALLIPISDFSPDGINMSNSQKSHVLFSPNPATTELTITSSNKIESIVVISLLGKTLRRNYYSNEEEIQLDIAGLPVGIYFIKVNGSEVRKFIKQ